MPTSKSNQTEPEVHYVNVRISRDLKEKVRKLALKYDRPIADMVRAVLKIGIPMMEGISTAEEMMVKEYIKFFRRLRQVRSLKDI